MTRRTSDYDWIDALIAASVASKETIFRDLYGQIDCSSRFYRPTTVSSNLTLTSEEILRMSKADSNGSSATDAQRLEAAKRKVGDAYFEYTFGIGSYETLNVALEAYKALNRKIGKRKQAAEAEAARIAALPKLLDREEAAKMESLYSCGGDWGRRIFYTKDGIVRGAVDLANARAKAYYKSRYDEAKKGLTMSEAASAALDAIFA